MNIPDNLRYTKEHEWTVVEGSVATAGITAFAVEQLGDITLVELPEIGTEIEAGATIGTIESVKAISDLYAPVSGKISEINTALEDEPEKVNEDCYNAGWMIKLELTDVGELNDLLDAAAYGTFVESLED